MTGGIPPNVAPLDPLTRARILCSEWRRDTTPGIVARYRALRMLEAAGTRLPSDVWREYVNMGAVVTIVGGRT